MVVFRIGELHPERSALGAIKTWRRGSHSHVITLAKLVEQFFGTFHHIRHGKVFRVIHLFDEGVTHGDLVDFLVLLVEIQQSVQADGVTGGHIAVLHRDVGLQCSRSA